MVVLHALSASLVAAAGYVVLKSRSLVNPYLPTLALVGVAGVSWEVYELYVRQLTVYGPEDTVKDLVFDVIGWLLVALVAERYLSGVAADFAATLDRFSTRANEGLSAVGERLGVPTRLVVVLAVAYRSGATVRGRVLWRYLVAAFAAMLVGATVWSYPWFRGQGIEWLGGAHYDFTISPYFWLGSALYFLAGFALLVVLTASVLANN